MGLLWMTAGAAPYAQTPWPATHGDGRNANTVDFSLPLKQNIAWRALEDRAVVQAATIGPSGRIYVTTGRGRGYPSLTALSRDGQILWESSPYWNAWDLDSWAILSSAVVDEKEDLYLTDGRQFWAVHGDGTLKWKKPLFPALKPSLSVQFLKSAVVAVTGDGWVLARNRENGRLAALPFRLPWVASPTPPPSFLEGLFPLSILVDPEIIFELNAVFQGFSWPVANTPAVHPTLSRLYIPARRREAENISRQKFFGKSGEERPQRGDLALYAVDFHEDKGLFSLAFMTFLSKEWGAASPVVSKDGKRVYVGSNRREIAAIDAYTGEILWRKGFSGGILGAPTEGVDGTLYVIAGSVVALSPEDGQTLWEKDMRDLIVTPVGEGRAGAFADSIITASANALYLTAMANRAPYFLILDPKTGNRLSEPLLLPASCEAYVTVDRDGSAYVSHYGYLTNTLSSGGITALKP
mgnify:CR=1 FL=1